MAITVSEAAKKFGVSVAKIANLIKKGDVKVVGTNEDGKKLVDEDEVAKALRPRKEPVIGPKVKVFLNPKYDEPGLNIGTGKLTIKKGEIVEVDLDDKIIQHYLRNKYLVIYEDDNF
jgi:hypothetical protein